MRFVRFILSNLATFAIALILAAAIWVTAVRANDPIGTRTLEISVETLGQRANASLANRTPESALITIQGPDSILKQVSPADYTGVIDLSEVPFGEEEVTIQVQGSRDQVVIISQFPESTLVRLDQIVTRNIPVVLDIRGEVARGHRVGEEQVEPQNIQVTGVASRVDQLSEARVTQFLDNTREDISELRRPTFYDLQGNVASAVGLTVNPSEVEIIIPVIELAGFAEKPITVNWDGEPAQGYRLLNVSVEPSSVLVTGPPGRLDTLRIETESIDISGLTVSETRQVALALPEGVTQLDPQPFVVTVEIGPILTSDAVQRTVEIRALGDMLTATLDPEIVQVFLFGPLPVLQSLAEDDVRVTVDLLNLEAGMHTLAPIVSITANDIEFRSTQPAVVSVFITGTITTTDEITDTTALSTTLVMASAVGQGDICLAPGASPAACAPPIWRRRLFAFGLWELIV